MILANDGEDHADGKFGDGFGGVGGDADDGEVEFCGGREVDVVEAGAAEGDVFLAMVSASYPEDSMTVGVRDTGGRRVRGCVPESCRAATGASEGS